MVEDAHLEAACTIGPFARLRPGAELLAGAHVGNFVEMKKARLGKGSKAGHLTYGRCGNWRQREYRRGDHHL